MTVNFLKLMLSLYTRMSKSNSIIQLSTLMDMIAILYEVIVLNVDGKYKIMFFIKERYFADSIMEDKFPGSYFKCGVIQPIFV